MITLSEFIADDTYEIGIEIGIDNAFSDGVTHEGSESGGFFYISGRVPGRILRFYGHW